MSDRENELSEDDFSDEEKEAIRRSSMINTYKLLVSNYDFSIFPDNLFWLLSDYNEDNVFLVLLDYFESTEEYELCADIKKMYDTFIRMRDNRASKKNTMIRYLIEPNDK
tara:strand:+ start:16484 stop:16813 length:330 start_codon:yes stop_codon:yes gene_type:complete